MRLHSQHGIEGNLYQHMHSLPGQLWGEWLGAFGCEVSRSFEADAGGTWLRRPQQTVQGVAMTIE